jgi:hypothetical protein
MRGGEPDFVAFPALIAWPALNRVRVDHLHGLILDCKGDP